MPMKHNETRDEITIYNDTFMKPLMEMAYCLGLSHEKLADAIGCTRSTINDYITGQRKISPRMRFKIKAFMEKGSS